MRFERDRYTLRPGSPRTGHDFRKHMGMRPVYAVEIAYADARGPEVGGNLVEFVKDLHRGKSTAEPAGHVEKTKGK